MTIPLDRLYNFLDDVVDQDIIIYRWNPHGSKLLEDLLPLKDCSLLQLFSTPVVICHDQEPLNYYLYSEDELINFLTNIKDNILPFTREQIKNIIILNNYTEKYIHQLIGNFLNVFTR